MSETFDYKTLFNQSTNRRTPNLGDQYTNVQNAQALYGPQGAIQPTAPRQPFRPFANFSLFPTVNASTNIAPTTTPTPGPNDQVVNTNRTFQTVRQEAEAGYLARATEYRDLAQQGIQRTGADQYSQARMAMEQQRALSDTRGLTAGAREGANQMLSATQQVALNQIESQTQSELLQLQQQGIQDEFLAQEWADIKVKQFQTESEEAGYLASLNNDYQAAVNRNADEDELITIRNEQRRVELQLYGKYLSPEEQAIFTDPNTPEAELDARTIRVIERITDDANLVDGLVGLGLIAIGTIGIAASGAVSLVGGVAVGIPLATLSKVALAAGIVSVTTGFALGGAEVGKEFRSTDQEVKRTNRLLNNNYKKLVEEGFTPEEARAAVDARLSKLPPVFRTEYNRNYGG
jgi:hypothetical protein